MIFVCITSLVLFGAPCALGQNLRKNYTYLHVGSTNVSTSSALPVSSPIECAISCLRDTNCVTAVFCDDEDETACDLYNMNEMVIDVGQGGICDVFTRISSTGQMVSPILADMTTTSASASTTPTTTTTPTTITSPSSSTTTTAVETTSTEGPCQNGGSPGSPCICPSYTAGVYCENIIQDCKDVADHVSQSTGTYTVWPTYSTAPFSIGCYEFYYYSIRIMYRYSYYSGCMTTPVTFLAVPWETYKNGFTHSNCYMWLGLEKIHALTASKRFGLTVNIKKPSNDMTAAIYDSFSIGNETAEYQLSLSGFSANGIIGDHFNLNDPLKTVNGAYFCTQDRCMPPGQTCGSAALGGWWYREDDCQSGPHHEDGIMWNDGSSVGTMKEIEMYLVPVL